MSRCRSAFWRPFLSTVDIDTPNARSRAGTYPPTVPQAPLWPKIV